MNFNKSKTNKKQIDLALTAKLKFKAFKRFHFKIKKSTGRDQFGQLMYHRGGGVKQLYRLVSDAPLAGPFRIIGTTYDPYRSNFINLIQYRSGEFAYTPAFSWIKSIHTKNSKCLVVTNTWSDFLQIGARLPLIDIPNKHFIYQLSINKELPYNSTVGKAAGSCCKLLIKEGKKALILYPSGVKKYVPLTCYATIGTPGNIFRKLNKQYKAGSNRNLNRRPVVRGVAMNPVDHPHGGGEGKSTSGRPCVSPWGKLTKGVPTRKR